MHAVSGPVGRRYSVQERPDIAEAQPMTKLVVQPLHG